MNVFLLDHSIEELLVVTLTQTGVNVSPKRIIVAEGSCHLLHRGCYFARAFKDRLRGFFVDFFNLLLGCSLRKVAPVSCIRSHMVHLGEVGRPGIEVGLAQVSLPVPLSFLVLYNCSLHQRCIAEFAAVNSPKSWCAVILELKHPRLRVPSFWLSTERPLIKAGRERVFVLVCPVIAEI